MQPCFFDAIEAASKDCAKACILAFGPSNGSRGQSGIQRHDFESSEWPGTTYKYIEANGRPLYDNFAIFEGPYKIIWAFRGTDVQDSKRLLGSVGPGTEALDWTSLVKLCAFKKGVAQESDCDADHYIFVRQEAQSKLHQGLRHMFEAFLQSHAAGSKQVVVSGSSLGANIAAFVARPGMRAVLFSPGGAPGPRPSWLQTSNIVSYREMHDIVSLSTIHWWPTYSAKMTGSSASTQLKYHNLATFFCDDEYYKLTGMHHGLADNQVIEVIVT